MKRLIALCVATVLASALLVGSTGASPTTDIPVGATPYGDGYALELKAPVPDWYTPALDARVEAAGRKGVPVPARAGKQYSSLAFAGIRPGAWIISPAGCTTNFVFGSPGSYHIGTAGHCASVGDEITLVALPGVLMKIGRVVKSVDGGIGNDFALIQIYPEMQDLVNPSMSYFGGPTATEQPSFGDAVLHSGHGLVIGTGGTPRAGLVTFVGDGDPPKAGGGGSGGCKGKGCKKKTSAPISVSGANPFSSHGTAFGWDGAAAPGDSGSAVRDAFGAAAGNLTHLVVGIKYLPAFIAGTTAPHMEAIAGMPIATASLVPDPLW